MRIVFKLGLSMATNHFLPIVTLALLACAVNSPGTQKSDQNPIDIAMADCIDKHPSTAGMNACTEKATAMWDSQMNKDYKKLSSKVSADTRQKLVIAQREYSHASGSMYSTMKLSDRNQVVKARATSIHAYLDLVTDIADSRGK